MNSHKELYGSLVTLKPLEYPLINQYLAQFSPIVQTWLHVDSLDAEKDYLLSELEHQKRGNSIFYVIFDAQKNELVGAIAIRDPYTHRGQLYCWMHEKYWGTGLFQEALQLATKAYFQLTGRQVLSARVDVTNTRSYRALKKSGFADAGIVSGPYGKQYELLLRKKP